MYCDLADVRERLPEVTNEYVSDTTIADIITKQGDRIDDMLRQSYTVPFATVPSTIVDLCTDKSLYKVMQTFPDANFDKDLIRLAEDIRGIEDDLISGRLKLDDGITSEAPTGSISEPYFKLSTTVVEDE